MGTSLRTLTFAMAMLASFADAAHACPMPPPPVRDLALDRYYSDADGSKTDAALLAEHQRSTAPVRDHLQEIVKQADASLRQSSPSLAKVRALCALEWLEVWARGEALLGNIDGKQSEAERRWTLAGTALAYLKVKPLASPEQRVEIEAWLMKLADAAHGAFDDLGMKRNNHWYWMGLGHAAVGLAANSDTHWALARSVFQDAARDIKADGSLPLEVARGSRALHYHAFAAMPLVTMASLARMRGEHWEQYGDGALSRFVTLTMQGVADPAVFDTLAGVPQERPVKPSAAWLPLYKAMHPEWSVPEDMEMASGHRSLGGNVLLLRQHVTVAWVRR